MIQSERIRHLNEKPVIAEKKYVLYWMQQAQRYEYNHALEYAIEQANKLNKPLVVGFGLTDRYPEANERHYYFMLQGLQETVRALTKRGIRTVVQQGSPELVAVELSREACLVIADRGYLGFQQKWRSHVAEKTPCLVIQVETDVVVPISVASTHEEYSAATIRRKIHVNLDAYLIPIRKIRVRNRTLRIKLKSLPLSNIDRVLHRLKIDRSVSRATEYHGGTSMAKRTLGEFIKNKLSRFVVERNDPSKQVLSSMSPYLHFGQISPLYIALQVKAALSPGTDAYLEELIVRRELAMNYVYYNRNYGSFNGLPEWAQRTLKAHHRDIRPYTYRLSEFEQAQTHDVYWNAAQREMTKYGKMHGYMRMYWGKKIIEWTRDPVQAFEIALYLNNKYEIDGRDANGYAGVAWCFGKHDRPWAQRKIFGNVRYMNANGLKRKFPIENYVNRILKGD
ncbi:MAG: deoxyribodipyrimidine photo-lyase [candidate division WOR-3 bacterium]|nr:MAG: deoxyribodipyrimidine photo-lyase [candidate division WOR-3 bacterium]